MSRSACAFAVLALLLASCSSSPTGPSGDRSVDGLWRLVSVNVNGAITPAGSGSTLELSSGRLTVVSTCNRCTGSYSVSSSNLSISPLACTRMACPGDSFAETFIRLVQQANTAAATPGSLRLAGPEAQLLFER